MTSFDRLKIELDGMTGLILSYSDDAYEQNMVNQLHLAINERDKERILYCLSCLVKWYDDNMGAISLNGYVGEKGHLQHVKNKKLIQEFIDNLQSEGIPFSTQNEYVSQAPLIFLSHKSDDKKYGDALRDFIIGLGVPNASLIYTSHPLHKIPLDKNIYDYLRENISGNVFVIILWSNKYLASPACLNEMGAAWVAQKDYTNIYIPEFDFGNPKYHECAVDTRKMGAVLNGNEHCKASMIELKNKIQALFNLENDEANSQYLLDQFINKITEANHG